MVFRIRSWIKLFYFKLAVTVAYCIGSLIVGGWPMNNMPIAQVKYGLMPRTLYTDVMHDCAFFKRAACG